MQNNIYQKTAFNRKKHVRTTFIIIMVGRIIIYRIALDRTVFNRLTLDRMALIRITLFGVILYRGCSAGKY